VKTLRALLLATKAAEGVRRDCFADAIGDPEQHAPGQ
jgi:hypothetical protein